MLQFMDCSNCGKRVRTTAAQCHHCHQPIISGSGRKPSPPNQVAQSPSQLAQADHDAAASTSQAHYAVNGGYDTEDDDFDYDEFLANEFPDQTTARSSSVKPWVWITAWILIVATLLPFLYYFLAG